MEVKIRLGTDMHASLVANKPGSQSRAATKKRIQKLTNRKDDVDAAQRLLICEIEQTILKRDTFMLKARLPPPPPTP